MDTQTFVYVDLEGTPVLAGRLWSRMRKGRNSASFEYDPQWLERPDRFALEPALVLAPGPFHTNQDQVLFGAIGDSAPDRWGRVLMRRAVRRDTGETQTLREIDYLLRVNDEARQGALRFADEVDGPFLATDDAAPIPPLVALPRLLAAADHVTADSESDEDLRLLLAPGSSLGGARPKASVKGQDGKLLIAKFPHRDDENDSVRWEAVALSLARKAGVVVPDWRVEIIGDQPVLLLDRFDRRDGHRVPFLSAMSMLGAVDNQTRSYLEIADSLRRYGAQPRVNMHQLWRRIVFNVLISNTDDHLRNHGFLYDGPAGWCLSPAYDLNPMPVEIRPRVLSTAIDLDATAASLGLALGVAGYFDLDQDQACEIAREVGQVVTAWREEAQHHGLSARQIDRMASAFEHEDLRQADGM